MLFGAAFPASAQLGWGEGGSGGKVTVVEEGLDTLKEAVANASAGDTLQLRPGVYELGSTVLIDKDLTIQGARHNRGLVHIVAVPDDEFNFDPALFLDPLDQGHLLFATDGARRVVLRHFTIKNAPETAISEGECEEEPPFGYGLNHTECFGDAIHSDGVAEIEVTNVEASLNAGNGLWIDGAETAVIRHFKAVNNGAFGIDVDTAQDLRIEHGTFIANQVSGIEASGHPLGLTRDEYTAVVSIEDARSHGNGEIGIEIERFKSAYITNMVCADNREDGFDADRVGEIQISHSRFVNNLDDGIELFPVDVQDPNERPADFPGSIILDFRNLYFSGNVAEDVNFAPTEN